MIKIKKKEIKKIEKKNKLRIKIIKLLKNRRKKVSQYVINNFRSVNKVILRKEIEQYQHNYEGYSKKNEKLIEGLKKQENKSYFTSLDINKKINLISLQSNYDEESEDSIDNEIDKKLNRYSNYQKRVIHKHLNELLRENIKKWTKKGKKEVEEEEN